jgi:hypothetical protein
MPRFDDPMNEYCEWIDRAYTAAENATEAVEDAWGIHYEEGSWFTDGKWKYDPIPTNEHIDRLESTYEEFKQAVYDVELEWLLHELYENLDTPEETDDKLGF